MIPETLIGGLNRIEKDGHRTDVFEDAGNHLRQNTLVKRIPQGQIHMEAVAGLIRKRFWGEVRSHSAELCDRLYDSSKSQGVIGRSQSIRITEVNFVLPGTFFVVRALRMDSHFFKRKADLTADIFSVIVRSDVHVSGRITRNLCRAAVFIPQKQIEFLLGAEREFNACGFGFLDSFFQETACIARERSTVRVRDIGKHLHDPAVFRPPGERHQCLRVRMQEQIAVHLIPESVYRRGVKRDAVCEGPLQFIRHDRDVLLPAEHIAESETDELDILFENILHDLIFRILHN